jgi:hypothetical protein
MAHTVTYALDSVYTGKVYSFRVKALNSKGYSDYSEILRAAATDAPPRAPTPTVDYSLSSKSSLYISWQLLPNGLSDFGTAITGY